MSTHGQPIARLDLLEKAIQDESPDLLAQWLALGHDVNDPRLATPKSDWDPIDDRSRAVAMWQCLSSD